jgi:hypothetical protein
MASAEPPARRTIRAVTSVALEEIQRPLKLGELLAASMKIYSARGWAFVPLGAIQGAAIVAVDALSFESNLTEFVVAVALYALTFTLTFALVARLVTGDSVGVAATRTLEAAPALLALAVVVGVPFALGGTQLILLVFSALWLGLTSFAVPGALIDAPRDNAQRLTRALQQTTALARVEYWHAAGIASALLVIYVVLAIPLAIVLAGAADLNRVWALAVAQVPLAPFFFIGLTVLYYDQRARARELTEARRGR